MTLNVNTDTLITNITTDGNGDPAIMYVTDSISVRIAAGIYVASGGNGIFSDKLSSRLINNGNINSALGCGVLFSNTGESIVNKAGATIVGASGIFFEGGQGTVTNHGVIRGLGNSG